MGMNSLFNRVAPALLVGFVLLAFAPAAQGALIYYGTSNGMTTTGSRDDANGLTIGGTGHWSGLTIDWTVTGSGSAYHYLYEFSGFTAPAISHFILDLTDDCLTTAGAVAGAGCVSNTVYSDGGDVVLEYKTYSPDDPGNSNPFLPGIIVGVKFNELGDEAVGGFSIEFDSNRAPVWGDFYMKGGNTTAAKFGYAYNDGLAVARAGDSWDNALSTTHFIARPDGGSGPCYGPGCDEGGGDVPEPATMSMLGLGLGLLAVRAVRARSKK